MKRTVGQRSPSVRNSVWGEPMARGGLEEASVATETRKNKARPAAVTALVAGKAVRGGEQEMKCDRRPIFSKVLCG